MNRIIYTIIIITLVVNFSCSAQNECEKLKNKEISLSYINDHKIEFINDIEVLMNCYYDSIDLQILKGPLGDNLEYMLNIIELTDLSKVPIEHSTYSFFIELWDEMKKTEQYKVARQIVIAKNEIIYRNANIENWENDYPLLQKMTFTDDDINRIKEIVENHVNTDFTYYEVFQELASYYQSTTTLECSNPSYAQWFHFPFNLDSYFELSEGLECSNITNKPVLLYFSGHGSLNSRIFEAEVISDPEIQKILRQKFVITCLYVDDVGTALLQHQIFNEKTNDTIHQVGKINKYYQIELFNDDIQPAFYIIDSYGNQYNESYYFDNSIDSFNRFLISGLEKFYEK